MTLGLGSGSTAEILLDALARAGRRWPQVTGGHLHGVGDLARERGIPVAELAEVTRIDLAVDGADEIETGALGW